MQAAAFPVHQPVRRAVGILLLELATPAELMIKRPSAHDWYWPDMPQPQPLPAAAEAVARIEVAAPGAPPRCTPRTFQEWDAQLNIAQQLRALLDWQSEAAAVRAVLRRKQTAGATRH